MCHEHCYQHFTRRVQEETVKILEELKDNAIATTQVDVTGTETGHSTRPANSHIAEDSQIAIKRDPKWS